MHNRLYRTWEIVGHQVMFVLQQVLEGSLFVSVSVNVPVTKQTQKGHFQGFTDCEWRSKFTSGLPRTCRGHSFKYGTQYLIVTPLIDLCERVFLSRRCFPRRTAVAFKFTWRLKVEWQGEGERSTGDVLIVASEDRSGWGQTGWSYVSPTVTQTGSYCQGMSENKTGCRLQSIPNFRK